MSQRPHRKPTVQAAQFFDGRIGGTDPALVSEAADRAAALLVRGARSSDDEQIAQRVLLLAETEGLETLADLWSGAPADSLAGCLWRLYVLRAWVHGSPHQATQQFEAGRTSAQVARVVAGVADPPGPDQLKAMIDTTLAGIAQRDFADVLLRASAFARVVAAGRAHRQDPDAHQMLVLSEQLEAAAHQELESPLA
ncbi:hypothetical protein ncot_15825 [Nocardioides sp. JQ2195]|uniref:hypothetical protein n=1 Tax=Nocardioides sp. JQ2195 TaxID=2592334 RepID=UPI00143E3135|nr:hypothetical protein [Nocardioides sp. JQ2195]QIX27891.1 hypothetical protein ncot_15825 [Nocardioides sp. JQ2195]